MPKCQLSILDGSLNLKRVKSLTNGSKNNALSVSVSRAFCSAISFLEEADQRSGRRRDEDGHRYGTAGSEDDAASVIVVAGIDGLAGGGESFVE